MNHADLHLLALSVHTHYPDDPDAALLLTTVDKLIREADDAHAHYGIVTTLAWSMRDLLTDEQREVAQARARRAQETEDAVALMARTRRAA